MPTLLPWVLNQRLHKDSIEVVAKIIIDTRLEALASHDVDAGDSSWGLGCRSYDRTKNRIIMLAEKGEVDWLEAKRSEQFRFSINGVPCGFYRGEAENPNQRTMRRTNDELQQGSLIFEDEVLSPIWRFAVCTADTGEVVQVSFVGLTGEDGKVVSRYDVPANAEHVLTRIDTHYEEEQPVEVSRTAARRRKDGEQVDAKGSSKT